MCQTNIITSNNIIFYNSFYKIWVLVGPQAYQIMPRTSPTSYLPNPILGAGTTHPTSLGYSPAVQVSIGRVFFPPSIFTSIAIMCLF